MPVTAQNYLSPTVFQQSIAQYGSYARPGQNGGGVTGSYYSDGSTYQSPAGPSQRPTQARPTSRPQKPGTTQNDYSKRPNSNFNRLPPAYNRPEFDDYDGVDNGEDNESGEHATNENGYNQGNYNQGNYNQGYNQPPFNCIPFAPQSSLSGLGLGLFKLKPFGLGLFRDTDGGDGRAITPIKRSDEGRELPPDDPRTLFKLQYNAYNYGAPLYKPTSGYPCYPVQPYGYRPGLLGGLLGGGGGTGPLGFFGQGGLLNFGGVRPGGVFGDSVGGAVNNRPSTAQVLSDTVKPVFESTAIQDGIGQTVSNSRYKNSNTGKYRIVKVIE